MKIVYCQCSVYNPGGMERVLLNKVGWLASRGHEVVVVTTDQGGRPPFYRFPAGVRMIDLGIGYSDDNGLPLLRKTAGYLRRRRLHRRRLTELLMRERPDVTVSLFPSESSFIPAIGDGSRKVLELHFNRFFRMQYGRGGLTGLIDRLRSRADVRLAGRFDRFVVLTGEDRGYWGAMENIEVIPNAAMALTEGVADLSARRVIAVGRLDSQKGFDRLLRIWALVKGDGRSQGWTLSVFGQGEWRGRLGRLARELGIDGSVTFHEPVGGIGEEYLRSSILVMTSRFEGFPMVMVEGMAMGLPVVSYDFKCGPRDIIRPGENGLIVREGDEKGFADALLGLMADGERRRRLGAGARGVAVTYSQERVMGMWMDLFGRLMSERQEKK